MIRDWQTDLLKLIIMIDVSLKNDLIYQMKIIYRTRWGTRTLSWEPLAYSIF